MDMQPKSCVCHIVNVFNETVAMRYCLWSTFNNLFLYEYDFRYYEALNEDRYFRSYQNYFNELQSSNHSQIFTNK